MFSSSFSFYGLKTDQRRQGRKKKLSHARSLDDATSSKISKSVRSDALKIIVKRMTEERKIVLLFSSLMFFFCLIKNSIIELVPHPLGRFCLHFCSSKKKVRNSLATVPPLKLPDSFIISQATDMIESTGEYYYERSSLNTRVYACDFHQRTTMRRLRRRRREKPERETNRSK